MKKPVSIAILTVLAILGGWYGYNRYMAPTHVAFVNYSDHMYDAVAEANDNGFITTTQVPFSPDTFEDLSQYSAVHIFAHAGIRFSHDQTEQLQALVDDGVLVVYRSPVSTLPLEGLDGEAVTYQLDCIRNGGRSNHRRMLNYIRREIDGKRLFVDSFEPAFILPESYYYYLGDEEVFSDIDDYIQFLKNSGKFQADGKNICLLATQFGNVTANGYIARLVGGFEAQGHNVFPMIAARNERPTYIKQTNPDLVVYIPHGKVTGEEGTTWLKELNVPVLCPIVTFAPEEEWLVSKQGMDGGLLSQSVTMPEIDGGVVPMVVAAQFENERGLYVFEGVDERIRKFLSLTEKWFALQNKPNPEKKVAIFYYKGAGKNAMVAEGLELAPSILNLLRHLKDEGYSTGELPESAEDLAALIEAKGPIFGTYAQGAIDDFLNSGDPVLINSTEFETLLRDNLDPSLIGLLENEYGPAPGDFMTARSEGDARIMVARVDFGNVVLLPVPPPGLGEDEVELAHGTPTPPPYPYVASYLWARTRFNADAIVHLGTHGTVEFRPEKQVALSHLDWPDALLAGTPHFYLYVISNIGEAVIAKRRTYAVMDTHLTPPLIESDIYGPLLEIDDTLEKFWNTEQPLMKEQYRQVIHELAVEADLLKDMEFEIPEGEFLDDLQLNHLHHYLHELEQAKITKGLHVLGEDYTTEEIGGTLRLMALDSLVFNKKKMDLARGRVTEAECEDAHFMENHYREPATEIIDAILHRDIDPLSFLSVEDLEQLRVADEADKALAQIRQGGSGSPQILNDGSMARAEDPPMANPTHQALLRALKGYRNTLISIRRYERDLGASPQLEMDALINSLNGGYTAPQSGGDPAFNPEAVPTGRNLYSINETKTPSREAFDVAKKLVNTLLKSHLHKHGQYPKKVAFSLWSSEFIRQEGITIAQILYCLGVEPVTDRRGTVHDVQLIPLEELGRPRIDVVVQTSGQFRDLAATRIYLINRAVKLASEAPGEGPENNYVKRGVVDSEAIMKENGISPSQARALASVRVFGGLNGSYGAGIMDYVESGDRWESEDEIARRYLITMGTMYDENLWGDFKPGAFEGALQNASLVVHPRSANTWGALSLDHVYEFMGGVSNVIRYVTGRDPDAIFSDLRNPNDPRLQSLEEAIWMEARTTVLNPRYIEGMQAEGRTAAETFAETFRNTYGWESMKTSAVDPELWDNLNEVYIEDVHELGIEEFFRTKNPYALQEMTAVMLETVRKGYWQPDSQVVRNIAALHARLVMEYDAGCSGFVCDNAKLRQMISGLIEVQLQQPYNDRIERVRTAIPSQAIEGMELEKQDTDKPLAQRAATANPLSPIKLLLIIGASLFVVVTGYRLAKKR